MNKLIFFDCETNGKALNFKAPYTDTNNWPRIVQMAWAVYTADEKCERAVSFLVKPDGWVIPQEVVEIHGITTEMCEKDGISIHEVLSIFNKDSLDCRTFVAHNVEFDKNVVSCEYHRIELTMSFVDGLQIPYTHPDCSIYCTMKASTNFCRLPGSPFRGQFKWPKLVELHEKLFGVGFEGAHAALTDVQAMAKCYFELQRRLLTKEAKEEADAYLQDTQVYSKYDSEFRLLENYNVKIASQQGLSTGALLCCNVGTGKEIWIPKSQLRHDVNGALYVSNWFFKKLPR